MTGLDEYIDFNAGGIIVLTKYSELNMGGTITALDEISINSNNGSRNIY